MTKLLRWLLCRHGWHKVTLTHSYNTFYVTDRSGTLELRCTYCKQVIGSLRWEVNEKATTRAPVP